MTQDRTRAIVESAEALHSALLEDYGVSFAASEAAKLNERVRERIDELSAAIALPAPQWTRTPPQTEGHYWVRGFGAYGVARMIGGTWQFPGLTRFYEAAGLFIEHEVWPIRIEEPPA